MQNAHMMHLSSKAKKNQRTLTVQMILKLKS